MKGTNVMYLNVYGKPCLIRNGDGELNYSLLHDLFSVEAKNKDIIAHDSNMSYLILEVLESREKLARAIESKNREYDNLNQLFYDTLSCRKAQDIVVQHDSNGCVKINSVDNCFKQPSPDNSFRVFLDDLSLEQTENCFP